MNRRVNCLLVDDLEENLLALSAVLRRDGVHLLLARSGAEALELLLAHDVALAIVDVQMPEMDGFELAELMHGSERTRHVPIIFVTAGSHEGHRVSTGYNAGAVDFLHKPVDPAILESKAAVFFELYRHRARLVEELQHRTETLRLNEMFTAVLGHDLRNPLNAILTGASLLEKHGQDDLVHKVATRILSSGRRMSRLIDDLLDLTRARLAGGLVIERRETDLSSLIERVAEEHQSSFPARRLELAREGDLTGEWDAGRMQQMVSNLVGNALQHGDPSGPVHVRLDGTSPALITLSVGNAGVIPPDVVPHLFTPFQRGDSPKAGDGLGLGLFIAQQIARAHGGDITVASCASEGTLFRVELPRYAPGATARLLPDHPLEAGEHEPARRA